MAPRILVVDDDPSVLRMLVRTLGAEGHEVEAAPDGGAALVAVERRAPDAVVLDVAMPGPRRARGVPSAARRAA